MQFRRVGEETSARAEDKLAENLVDLGFDLADERVDSLLNRLETAGDGREKEKLAVETLEEAEVESEQRMD